MILTQLFAQSTSSQTSSTNMLSEVTLSGATIELWTIGSKIDRLDSLVSMSHSLSDLLINNSQVQLKLYGQSGIASSSIRGASAAQTQVSWNGLILNQLSTGQYDLSILNPLFIDDLAIQYGPMSSIGGEGAVGGAIHTNTNLSFDKGLELNQVSHLSSMSNIEHRSRIHLSSKKHAFDLRLLNGHFKNNYSFVDPYYGAKSQVEHAMSNSSGTYISYAFKPNPMWLFKANFLEQDQYREIPASLSEALSKSVMTNSNTIFQLRVYNQRESVQSNLNIGLVEDQLNYNDSLRSEYSTHISKSFSAAYQLNYDLNHNSKLKIDLSYHQDNVESESLNHDHSSEETMTGSLHFRRRFSEKFVFMIGLRQDYIASVISPHLPSLGLEYSVNNDHLIKAAISRSYRRPSWNDLYWQDLGNLELKDEDAWMFNFSIQKKNRFACFEMQNELSVYYGIIDNWILWKAQSHSFFWQPENVQKVLQRGVELESTITMNNTHSSVSVSNSLALQYTSEESLMSEGIAGAQLIYTPIFKSNHCIKWAFNKWSIFYQEHVESKRYTSTDHNNFLNSYSVGNLGFMYSHQIGPCNYTASIELKNIWNSNYFLVADKPMPLRYLNLNLNLNF